MSKRILITGSCGFVGSHIVEHIHKNTDWHVIGIDSFKHRGDSMRVGHLDHNRYTVLTHDLATPISDIMINKIGHVDYIINNASESHVDRSIDDPRHFIENNVGIAVTMLELTRKIKPDKYIQISTDEVYGPAKMNHYHKEWESPHLPSNPYSASKAAQVDISISYWRTYSIPLIITETMNIIGERQDSEKFLPMIIKKIYKGEEVIVHGNSENIGSRYYLHARNQADALLFLLKNHNPVLYYDDGSEIIKPDRFNIAGEEEVNNLKLAEMVADIMGKPLYYKLEDFHKIRKGHDRRYALDGEKMKNLGWSAPIPFKESLIKIIKWTLENKEWLL